METIELSQSTKESILKNIESLREKYTSKYLTEIIEITTRHGEYDAYEDYDDIEFTPIMSVNESYNNVEIINIMKIIKDKIPYGDDGSYLNIIINLMDKNIKVKVEDFTTDTVYRETVYIDSYQLKLKD